MNSGMSNDLFSVAPATVADIPALCRLAEATWWHCYRGMISDEQIRFMLAWMYEPERLRSEMADGVDWLLLCRAGATAPVGFAAWSGTGRGREARLHKLYVHPGHQRRGGAKALLDSVYRRAADAGYRRLSLTVNRHNRTALQCYQRAGFHPCGTQVRDIGGGFVMDDYILARPLAAD